MTMIVKLVLFEDGVCNIGFRRISALTKAKYQLVEAYIYNIGGVSTYLRNAFIRKRQDNIRTESDIAINPEFVKEIAGADVIGFSGASKYAMHIKRTISLVRALNNRSFIVWGGVHATVFPEDAIQYADAVCVGEGEKSFLSLLEKIDTKAGVENCPGFWIRKNGTVIKNSLLPLMNNEELSSMPFQDYGFDIWHVTDKGLALMSKDIYFSQMVSKYSPIWVLGCPFRCSYCSNNKFIMNDKGHAKLRHSSVEHLIGEISQVLKEHDYVRCIELVDDNFAMLDLETIRQFAHSYKNRIGLPLSIFGFHPLTVNKDKLDILVEAGLKKVRMGIQSGSKKTLSFYHRDNNINKILDSSDTLSHYVPKIIPPFYDIILDNPVETEEDKLQTLMLLYKLKRPFLLYVYSLRVIPGTELYEYAQNNRNLYFQDVKDSYQLINDKQTALVVYLLSLWKPPAFIFFFFLRLSKIPYLKTLLFYIFQVLYLTKALYYELRNNNYQYLAMVSPQLVLFFHKMHKRARRR